MGSHWTIPSEAPRCLHQSVSTPHSPRSAHAPCPPQAHGDMHTAEPHRPGPSLHLWICLHTSNSCTLSSCAKRHSYMVRHLEHTQYCSQKLGLQTVSDQCLVHMGWLSLALSPRGSERNKMSVAEMIFVLHDCGTQHRWIHFCGFLIPMGSKGRESILPPAVNSD